jgi:DnaK suppressor protein
VIRNIDSFRKTIESRLEQTNSSPDWRDSIAVAPTSDLLDTAQSAVTREMVGRELNRNTALARLLRASLDRIANGTYGICVSCEDPVPSKRLAAVPWAPLCLSCQEKAERHRYERYDRVA